MLSCEVSPHAFFSSLEKDLLSLRLSIPKYWRPCAQRKDGAVKEFAQSSLK